MIDYVKLKEAHELAHKYANKVDGNFVVILQQVDYFGGQEEKIKYCCNLIEGGVRSCSLDDLIAKLQKLTQPEVPQAKYAVGDKVWYLSEIEPREMTIDKIRWCDDLHDYRVDLSANKMLASLPMRMLYPTKQALIEAQLKYWSTLAYEERSKPIDCQPCDHLWQNAPRIPGSILPVYPHSCAKCGVMFEKELHWPITEIPIDVHVDIQVCQHESDVSLSSPYLAPGQWFKIHTVCNKCGEQFEIKQEGKVDCQHEDDGHTYPRKHPLKYKCKKCGEFYR